MMIFGDSLTEKSIDGTPSPVFFYSWKATGSTSMLWATSTKLHKEGHNFLVWWRETGVGEEIKCHVFQLWDVLKMKCTVPMNILSKRRPLVSLPVIWKGLKSHNWCNFWQVSPDSSPLFQTNQENQTLFLKLRILPHWGQSNFWLR